MHGVIRFSTAALACLGGSTAFAVSDDCRANRMERATHLGGMIIEQLDLGRGPQSHPIWMREVMANPDLHEERISQLCAASPELKLTLAIERLYEPRSAGK